MEDLSQIPKPGVDGLGPLPVADNEDREKRRGDSQVPQGRRPHPISDQVSEEGNRSFSKRGNRVKNARSTPTSYHRTKATDVRCVLRVHRRLHGCFSESRFVFFFFFFFLSQEQMHSNWWTFVLLFLFSHETKHSTDFVNPSPQMQLHTNSFLALSLGFQPIVDLIWTIDLESDKNESTYRKQTQKDLETNQSLHILIRFYTFNVMMWQCFNLFTTQKWEVSVWVTDARTKGVGEQTLSWRTCGKRPFSMLSRNLEPYLFLHRRKSLVVQKLRCEPQPFRSFCSQCFCFDQLNGLFTFQHLSPSDVDT